MLTSQYYYSPMLLECKTNAENFPLNEEEIHQTFTNLGFVLNWSKRFSKALEICEKDTDRFIDVLQQFLTQPKFGTVCLHARCLLLTQTHN